MATTEKKTKALPNDWSFVLDRIRGEEEDEHGNFARDTMLCFVKHGTLALTFHANFDSGIVCSKCFQYMKPGSFALHCDKCDKQAVPSTKEIKKWSDSDKKWAKLKRDNPDAFGCKTVVKIAQRDGLSGYVVHPRLYLGKTSSTLKLKAICITDGCTHLCALNALHRHFKQAHMDATYRIRDVDVVEAPTVNDVEESADEGEEDEDESIENNDVGGVNMEEGSGDMEKGCHDVADNAVSVNMDVGGGDNEDREGGNEGGEVAGDAGRVNMEEGGGGNELDDVPEDTLDEMVSGVAEKEGGTKDGNSKEEYVKDTKMGEDVEEETGKEGKDTTNIEVGEDGKNDHVIQDMDCEPFVPDEGPSDNDSFAEQEQQGGKQVTAKKQRKIKTRRHAAVRKSSRTRSTTKHY